MKVKLATKQRDPKPYLNHLTNTQTNNARKIMLKHFKQVAIY